MNESKTENQAVPSVGDFPEEKNQDLASRCSRLSASLLDTLIMMLFTIPVMFFTGAFDGISTGIHSSFSYNLAMGLFGLFVFLLINFKLLKDKGQTVGKRMVGIKTVDMAGDQASWGQHFTKRYAIFFIPGQIPLIGQIFSIVNVLFIFGKEKRCIHDYGAGTQVVKC